MISYNILKYMHIIWYNIRIPEAIPSKHPMDPVVHPWGVRRAPRSSLSSEPGADEATNDMPKDRWYLGAKMRISATIYIYIYIYRVTGIKIIIIIIIMVTMLIILMFLYYACYEKPVLWFFLLWNMHICMAQPCNPPLPPRQPPLHGHGPGIDVEGG